MHITTALLPLLGLTTASNLPSPQTYFTNTPSDTGFSIPTIHESAILARRILRLETLGTLSTVFPSTTNSTTTSTSDVSASENRPGDVSGAPIGLMDYFGDCEPHTGNPTILAISIATSFKNVDAGSNITLSLRWHPQDGKWHSAAALPRFSLIGYLEEVSVEELVSNAVPACYVRKHPDAVAWLPGNRIHESRWVRVVVREVYWIGGFGDRAYIGWIPLAEWQGVTEKEIEGVRLPGEKSGNGGWWSWLGFESAEEEKEGWEL
jgi:hypothetical protein